MRLFCRLEKKGGEAARAFLFLAFPRAYRFLPLSVLWRPGEQARSFSNLNQVRPRRLSLGSAADRLPSRGRRHGAACAALSGSLSTWRVSFQNRITGRERSLS